jgi:hypothetical protein
LRRNCEAFVWGPPHGQKPWGDEALAPLSPRNFAALNQVAADASLWLMDVSLVELVAATYAREPAKLKI